MGEGGRRDGVDVLWERLVTRLVLLLAVRWSDSISSGLPLRHPLSLNNMRYDSGRTSTTEYTGIATQMQQICKHIIMHTLVK